MNKTPHDRFLNFVRLNDSGCWIWTGCISRTGYGRFRFNGKDGLAHRFSYMVHVGPIPDGMELDHLCRNRACCNWAHLEPVTRRANLLRGDTWAALNSGKTHCPQGHEYTPDNTYRYPDGRRRCIQCRRISDMRPIQVERRRIYKQRERAL